jgi:hypothetical protein
MNHNSSTILAVRSIRECLFAIHEAAYVPGQTNLISIEILLELGFSVENNLASLVVESFYHYPDTAEELTRIKVQNVFEIADLNKDTANPANINLGPGTITSMVDLSLSHTRAIWAQHLQGTILQEMLLGAVQPEEIARAFFPHMFADAL